MKKRKWFVIFVTLLAMIGFQLYPSLIFFNVTASIPLGIYVRIPATTFRDGDIVVYDPPEDMKQLAVDNGWLKSNRFFFIKKIATSGTVYHVGERFSINGMDTGPVFQKTPSGIELPNHKGIHIVPEGYFLPYGTNQYSFDGRYEGVVPMGSIIARVVPVWTQ